MIVKKLRKRKSLGQHTLVDKKVIDYEVKMADVENKRVFEIGGGPGNLTEELLKNANEIIIVEKDPIFVEKLFEKFHMNKNIHIIDGDFLNVDPKIIDVDIIIGNIPYSISSKIIFKLLEYKFEKALFCVQKEFAERVIAEPGTKDYSRLSVMSQIYFKPVFLRSVKRGSFRPVPNVDSAIILLYPKNVKMDKKRDMLIRMLFSHKNRTIKSALKSKEFDKQIKDKLIEKAKKFGIDDKRIFQLDVKEILNLVS